MFKKPYPYNSDLKENLGIIFFVSAFVVLFVWFFEPLNDVLELDLYAIIGYGLITFITTIILIVVVPYIFPKLFKTESWNVGKEVLRFVFIIFCIGIINYFYSAQFLRDKGETIFSLENLLQSITTTTSIGIMPIIIVVLYNQNRLLKKYIKESAEINDKIPKEPTVKSSEILIKGEGKNETIETTSDQLLFIKSEGNYCEVNTSSNKSLIRNSLANLESQLADKPSFLKVHRSYIVNTSLINNITGNAQGYKIHFLNSNEEVPVSRNNSNRIKQLFA